MLHNAIFLQLYSIRCAWIIRNSLLTTVKEFSSTDTDGFISQFGDPNLPANYMTCSPEGSYITLNAQSQLAIFQDNLYFGYFGFFIITYDLIFFNTWNNLDFVKYSFGSNQKITLYNDIEKVSVSKGFCNNQQAIIQSINSTINSTVISGLHKFEINSQSASVSIKNLIITALQCYGTCYNCFGNKFNQCSYCFSYGTLTPQNTCEYSCPSTLMYYVRYEGCKPACNILYQKYVKGICEQYPIFSLFHLAFKKSKSTEQFKFQIIYDFEKFNTALPENRQIDGGYIYGVFTNKQGIYRVVTLPQNQGVFMIAILMHIMLLNKIPPLSSIQFLINDTYSGQIYSDGQSNLYTDKLILYSIGPDQNLIYDGISYTNNMFLSLYMYADVQTNFTIKIIGNYLDSNAGWVLRYIQMFSGYCPSNCLRCEEKLNCAECQTGYLKSKWGTCSLCLGSYQQKINATHCQEDDDETFYSTYIIKEFTGLELDPQALQDYTLVSAVGLNFLKGSGIYYSIIKSQFRIFGGPFIWAQAKFQRIINIQNPHHAITISFIVVFGPNFPQDGQFIFSLDGMIKSELTSSNSAEIPIKHKQLHNQNSITVELECKGTNNEPIYAYCGFYSHYFTVHQCKPNCNSCSNQSDCLDSNYVEPITQCLNNQYFDQYQYKCQNCPTTCMTCTSYENCQTCIDTFTNPQKGCICLSNQYMESNRCNNCPQNCDQCMNSSKCTQCISGLFRTLINNVCVCQDRYFELNNVCKKCIQNCLKCSSLDKCDICLVGYQLSIYETCDQKPNTYFQQTLDKYLDCPVSQLCNPCQGINLQCSCGDMIITGDEFCDDGNQIKYDGCYECKFQCQPECTKCINGICYECATSGWYLDVSQSTYVCKEVCWDGLIVGKEKCDDAKSTTNCKDCQHFCRTDCLQCDYENGTCIGCREGLIPEKNYCIHRCGDGIVVSAIDVPFIEQCDDGNLLDYDGCSKTCQFQCQNTSICDDCQNNQCFHCINKYKLNIYLNRCECDQYCQSCDMINGQGCLLCQPGFKLIDQDCVTICGDSIVTSVEQCDDGNMIFGDGCHQCLKTCTIGCSVCNEGVCYDCHEGFQYFKHQCIKINEKYHDQRCNSDCLNCSIEGHGCLQCNDGFQKIDNKCYPICGDMVRVDPEQCDDQDLDFEDGCHQCQFNCLFSCSNCYQGVCYKCKEGYHILENICYWKIENYQLAQITNFQCLYLETIQFSLQSVQFNRIQVYSPEFKQQVYNQIGQYPERIGNHTNILNLQVDFKCAQNQRVNIQQNNYESFNKQSVIFNHQCHITKNHIISASFQLNKITVKDEILVIIITENQIQISLIVNMFLQNLITGKFVDL